MLARVLSTTARSTAGSHVVRAKGLLNIGSASALRACSPTAFTVVPYGAITVWNRVGFYRR